MEHNRIWHLPAPAPEPQVGAIQAATGLSRPVAEILVRRGIDTPERATGFLQPTGVGNLPDPLLFKGMREAVMRLAQAVAAKETLLVHGDYDVDGVTSSAMLTQALRALGCTVLPFVPNRFEDGYGISEKTLQRMQKHECSLLLTCDVGIAEAQKIRAIEDDGRSVIVTDHHGEPLAGAPEATAVVNPNQTACPYPDKRLAGIGVAYMLLRALYTEVGVDPDEKLNDYLDLVALGTVADVVPLRGVNRQLVTRGIDVARDSPSPGLLALLNVAKVPVSRVDAGVFGFQVGPRINAVGRMSQSSLALQCLLAETVPEAMSLARTLDDANRKRKKVQRGIEQEVEEAFQARHREDAWAIVEANPDWHVGIVGIVASRMVERYARPTFLFGRDPKTGVWKGSGRAPDRDSVDLLDLLHGIKEVFPEGSRYGGHKAAAGATLATDDPRAVDAFRVALAEEAERRMSREDRTPQHAVDAVVRVGEINRELLDDLVQLEPTGQDNRPASLAILGADFESVRVMGETGSHYRVEVKDDTGRLTEVVAFGMGDDRPEVLEWPRGLKIDLLGSPAMNRFRGRETVQFRAEDLRVHTGGG